MRRLMVCILLLSVAAPVEAQNRQTTLSPAYKRARLRALLEQWEARLPVVRQQADVSKAKIEELGPQVEPAEAAAETAQQQTRAARQSMDDLIDALTAEHGAKHGLDRAGAAMDSAEAELAKLRTELIAKLADDAEYRARADAVDAARVKVETLDADADAQQRLAAVAALSAAQSEVAAYEAAAMSADPRYAEAVKRADAARSEQARVRVEVNRLVKADERVATAERAMRDAQRATSEASRKLAEVQGQYRLYAGRYQSATAERDQLERSIVDAQRELGEEQALPR